MPLLQRQLASILALLAVCVSAECQDKNPAITAVNREVGLYFSSTHIAYAEYLPAWFNSEHGWDTGGGFKASAPFRTLRTDWLTEASYEYNDGTTKHTQPNTLPVVSAFVTNDMLVGVGPTFAPAARFSLTPVADAEYREWHRGLPGSHLDLIEHYTFWAPGVRVRVAYNPRDRVVLTGQSGFAYTVFPTMAGSGDASYQVPAHVFSLEPHDVWRAGLGVDYAMGRRVHAFGGIEYSRFGFGASADTYYGPGLKLNHHEPNSVTDLGRLNLGIAWSY
ncbi:MAG TPA: hypothetical protein VMI06_05340 [Terriglobia bacterium]|nr:hypothetical protein [Terriglobia bacterium]